MKRQSLFLTLAATTTGLTAGVFFAFQVALIPAFKTLSDREYIHVMQTINNVIQNPFFLGSFMGPLLLLPIATYLARGKQRSRRWSLLLVATLLYVVGSFGITVAANVPLNATLAQFALQTASPEQLAAARAAYEESWNNWHLVRTLASIGSLVLIVLACFANGQDKTVTK